MRRFLLRKVTATATVLTVVGVAVAIATAQSFPKPRAIHLTFVQTAGFFPHGQPQPGAVIGSTQRVRGDDGSKGTAAVLCTLITMNDRLCAIQLNGSRGLLALQGITHSANKDVPITVVGGTGAYRVARGSGAVNDTNQQTTEITVTLAR